MKVLIVEDDVVIAESLGNELSHWNYEVSIAKQFGNILEEFKTAEPELVLLDINLPTFNGYHWCQEIRKVSNVPIIFISSRTDNMDQIMAIQMGGDDFIEKPFNLSLTIAKIQALNKLFQNEGKYVNRTAIIEKCWESENFIDDNTLAVNMTRLRKKLQSIGIVDFIETKKNVGYKV